jgi:DNA/RNA-binding domain of Phe-tRNA-synthetase-like protein
MIEISPDWKQAFPGAAAGFLALSQVANLEFDPALEEKKASLESRLRAQYAGMGRTELASLPVLQAYDAYYRRFKKTYHVQLQLESLVLKGRSLPSVAALVEAMFMAELEDLLLTAGHDLDQIRTPVRLDVARGDEQYTLLRGQAQTLKPGDMYMADGVGVISSVIYGPDQRTQITPNTQRALFTVYAPAGVGDRAVQEHLERIADNVRITSPGASIDLMEVVGTVVGT